MVWSAQRCASAFAIQKHGRGKHLGEIKTLQGSARTRRDGLGVCVTGIFKGVKARADQSFHRGRTARRYL